MSPPIIPAEDRSADPIHRWHNTSNDGGRTACGRSILTERNVLTGGTWVDARVTCAECLKTLRVARKGFG